MRDYSELSRWDIALLREFANIFAEELRKIQPKQPEQKQPEQKQPRQSDVDEFIRIGEAAKRLDVSKSWLYKRWRDFPFMLKMNGTVLRASRKELEKWISQQKARNGRW